MTETGQEARRTRWRPAGSARVPFDREHLSPGVRVATAGEAWQIIEFRDRPVVDWDEHDHDAYFKAAANPRIHGPASPEAWTFRPFTLVLVRVNPPVTSRRRRHVSFRPWAGPVTHWHVLPEHYAVCADCGLLYPCEGLNGEHQASAAVKRISELEKILPGCCWECGDPITSRHRKVARFGGDNVWLPGAAPAQFHLADRICRAAAIRYEKAWAAVAPDQRTITLTCPGTRFYHRSSPALDCTNPVCPGPDAEHKRTSQCTTDTGDADWADGELRTFQVRPTWRCGFRAGARRCLGEPMPAPGEVLA